MKQLTQFVLATMLAFGLSAAQGRGNQSQSERSYPMRINAFDRARRIALSLLALTAVTLSVPVNAQERPVRLPNVVLIYADDMGYADLSAYGNRMIKTPNIDRLARDGVKFTKAYTTAALCSPSRAGLLTGRYQQNSVRGQLSNGAYAHRSWSKQADGKWVEKVLDEAEFDRRGIPKSEANIAEIVKPHGYRTAAIGKWHLGHAPEFEPHNRGFDFPSCSTETPASSGRMSRIRNSSARRSTATMKCR